jgi:unsaturated rhamnogalacturonyl hydrolase
MKALNVFIVTCLSLFTGEATGQANNSDLKNWPEHSSPNEIGKRIANRFVAAPHPNFGRPTPPKTITYPEVCTWFGALTFAKESRDKDLSKKLRERFDYLLRNEASMIPVPDHVDYTVFAAVPLELYIQNKQPEYLTLGKSFADKQWGPPEGPRVTPESHLYHQRGLTWQTRLWIDDMFMITAVQAQATRATNDQQYVDRAAREMVVYLDSLQRDNGLFYHAPDVPFFWGRGNGWMAAGFAELLRTLPENHPERKKIMDGYKKMMATLLKHQTKEGMWRQLIDDEESWPETSCTGMFTFAMITGVKNGWLDAEVYGAAARKGWLGLISYLDSNADIREVCQGTNKKNDRQYYLDRERIVGDMHGQAPMLWCATALLRK